MAIKNSCWLGHCWLLQLHQLSVVSSDNCRTDNRQLPITLPPGDGSVSGFPGRKASICSTSSVSLSGRATAAIAEVIAARRISGSASARRLMISSPDFGAVLAVATTVPARLPVRTRFSTARSVPSSGFKVIFRCAISICGRSKPVLDFAGQLADQRSCHRVPRPHDSRTPQLSQPSSASPSA